MTCEKCWKDLHFKNDFDKHMKFCTGLVNDMSEQDYGNDVKTQNILGSQAKQFMYLIYLQNFIIFINY